MSWWHSQLSPPAMRTCVYTSPADLTSAPSGCAPSAQGVWAVAAVETAQSTAGSQAQAPSLAPRGSAASTGQKLLILCQPCLPRGYLSDTVPPQAGTHRDREPPSAGDTTSPLQPPLTANPPAVPNLKTTAQVSPPSSWKQAWKLRGCRVITFSAELRTLYRKAQGDGGAPARDGRGAGRGQGLGSRDTASGKGQSLSRGLLVPCAPGGSPRSRDGKEDPRQHCLSLWCQILLMLR